MTPKLGPIRDNLISIAIAVVIFTVLGLIYISGARLEAYVSGALMCCGGTAL